ncbi:polysaccharide lyase family protein [Edaphobacter acidisoli]|nr:polysaccharide lyase family protein [Edaphobacter acidisoli]
MRVTVLFGLVLFWGAAFNQPRAVAQDAGSQTVFQLGTFDRSSYEFADGDPKQPVNFVVGKSDPAKDWYGMQAVAVFSGAKESGVDAAPRAIHFSLSGAPASAYKLHVAVLIVSQAVPALRVSVNGKVGTFYLHPRLDYSNGDQWDSFDPAYSFAEVEVAFPGNYLHKGDNAITLQAVEDADIPEGTIAYDAIALSRDTVKFRSEASSAQIVPTVFYKQQGGELDELVDVFVRYGRAAKAGSVVDLTVDGKHYHGALRGGQDFGEEKVEFAVAEFPAKSAAEALWSVSGRREHFDVEIDPQKKWTLYLAPHIHLDVGYSDYQAKVAAIHSHAIDEAMEMTAAHPDFRFSLDGMWPLEQFMKTRTPGQRARAIDAIKKQQLFVPANYANLLTGFPTVETLIRSLYPSADFSRDHGTAFNYATITDVPSWSWSYASVLAAAGVDELLGGSNNYRAPVLLQGRLNEDSPIWWEGPDGGKVLLWYSRHYQQMEMLFQRKPVLAAGRDTVPLFLQMYERPGYRADAAIIYGTQVENSDLVAAQAELAEKWNAEYAYPRIEYSGFHDALAKIAKQFGDDIPVMHGDGGPYWEDGIASDAYYAAMERQNESRAPSAEKLATLSTVVNPLLAADKAGLDAMWRNMVLMDEHTWDSYNSVSQPASREAQEQLRIKDQYAVNAKAQVDWLAKNSMAAIVNSIAAGRGSLVVFNTLNWKRSGPVFVDVDESDEIVDAATGAVAPMEVLSNHNGLNHVRFVAEDVPAVGYKVYTVRKGQKTLLHVTDQKLDSTVMESPYYRVTLDATSGAVRSVYDKELKRELVNQQAAYRFGQYLYVTGADKGPNTVLQYSPVAPKPQLEVHPASGGSLVSVVRTPEGWVARMKSSDVNTPEIVSEVRLFDHEKKIEFTEDVDKAKEGSKEAVYFAFPFAMSAPEFRYEVQNGVVDPAKDMYPGAGHEWFSAQHWVSVEQDGVAGSVMPLDASLVTLGDIFRGKWPEKFGERQGTVFSYVMNNYWDTNYAAEQGGHFRFRYVVTSAATTDAAALSRVGWEEATPLEVDAVADQDKASDAPRPLTAEAGSFLDAADPDLLLETWKPAEDGNGTVLRFLDLGGAARTVTVRMPLLHLEKAWETDAVERDKQPLAIVGGDGFQVAVRPHEIVTVRVVGSDVLKPPAL